MPKDAAYKQAEQKIADALRSGTTELDQSKIDKNSIKMAKSYESIY